MLKDAHEACQQKAREAAESGCNVVVIDNTNVRMWETSVYRDLAKKHNYTPLILEPQTPWAMDPKELAQKNSHGVSEDILIQKVCPVLVVLSAFTPSFCLIGLLSEGWSQWEVLHCCPISTGLLCFDPLLPLSNC